MATKLVFVTVGTTRFNALVEALDDLDVAEELAIKGYTHLIMQIGDGIYMPSKIVPLGALRNTLGNGLIVEMFKYAPDLGNYMKRADLVISHAGSGSLFEALGMGKAIIAVPNAILMANHQAELAGHLEALGHCKMATPDTLLEVLQEFDASELISYKPGVAEGIVSKINQHMAFA